MIAQLDEDRIAAYVAGELTDTERLAIERALDREPEWLEVVAALAQGREAHGLTPSRDVEAAERSTETDYAALLERAPILAPGALVGRFEILGRIAAGGMGVVYAAFDAELQRRVALKLARHRPRDRAARERLLREARALAQLSHPNVVSVYDVGTHEGRLYLAMELLEGPTLAAVLRRDHDQDQGERDWRAIVGLFVQAARGLEAAHRKGIVHRDFKPHNAIVEGERVVVIDFGLAAAPSDEAPVSAEGPELRLATLSRVGGTPAYMAPEQRRGEAVSARSDQYSLAVALHQALYGELPKGSCSVARPRAARVGSRRLQRALTRALAEEPADRFDDLAGLIRALEGATRRRWPTFAAAAGIAGLGLAGFLAGASTSTPTAAEDRCAGVRDELREVWSEPRRAALAARYSGFGRPYLVTLGERVLAAVDDYAARWLDAREASCRADRSAESRALERACLQGLEVRLDAYVRALTTGDLELAAHALEGLDALPKPRSCGDVEALRAQAAALPGTPDAAAVEAVEAIAAGLTEIQLLHKARRLGEALSRVEATSERARELGHLPTIAEVEAERAWILATKGDQDAAVEVLEGALAAAARGRVDRLIALLWTRRIWIDYEAGKIEAGRRAAAQADAWIARVGEPPELRFDYHQHLGWLEARAGVPAAAMEHFERSRSIAEDAALGDRELAIAIAGIGTARYSAGDLDGAAEALREAEARLAASLGADHPDVAKVGNNVGAILRAQGDLEGAEAIFERSLATLRQAYGDEHELVAQIQLNLGVLTLDRGRDAEALAILERAQAMLAASLGADHPMITIALARRGTALSNLGRFAEADEVLRAARERGLADTGEDPQTLASIELDLALNLTRSGQRAAAIPWYESAFARIETALGAEHSSLAPIASGLASALDSAGRGPEAAPLHRRAIELATPLEEAEFRLRYAEHLFARGAWDEAIAAADAALERHEAAPADPRIAAAARFVRGRALWRGGSADAKQRARGDVAAARALYAEASDADGQAAVDSWLAPRSVAR